MWDALAPDELKDSLDARAYRPPDVPEGADGPGVWQGFGSAVADALPSAAYTGAAAWSQMLDAYGKAQAYADKPLSNQLQGIEQPLDEIHAQTLGNDDTRQLQITRSLRQSAKAYAPDPLTIGKAGQIAHGVISSLGKAGFYALTAGPAAPAFFGADVGTERFQDLTDQGVDPLTAGASGAVSGVAGAAGIALPAAMGATRAGSAAIGSVLNPVMTAGETGAIHTILQHADYSAVAASYDPLDPVSLAVSAITGAAFGAAFHGKGETPRLTEDERAALLAMNEVRTRDADTLTQTGDLAAANAATDAQHMARYQLDTGEPVSVAHGVPIDPQALSDNVVRVADNIDGYGFAERTGRQFDSAGYGDGTAHTSRQIIDFYDRHVAHLEKGDQTPMPDSLFRIGLVNDDVANGLSLFLPGFRDSLREARISARSIKHIHDSRPSVARSVLQRIERGVLTADEVLPSPKNPNRALLVLKDIDTVSPKQKHGVTVVEIALNGTGIDVVSSMTSPAKYLKDARALAEKRVDDLAGGAAVPSSSLSADLDQQHHPAADFPKLGQVAEQSLAHPLDTTASPEIRQAVEIASRNLDAPIRLEDGTDTTMAEMLRHADEVDATAQHESAAFHAAVTCALRFPTE